MRVREASRLMGASAAKGHPVAGLQIRLAAVGSFLVRHCPACLSSIRRSAFAFPRPFRDYGADASSAKVLCSRVVVSILKELDDVDRRSKSLCQLCPTVPKSSRSGQTGSSSDYDATSCLPLKALTAGEHSITPDLRTEVWRTSRVHFHCRRRTGSPRKV